MGHYSSEFFGIFAYCKCFPCFSNSLYIFDDDLLFRFYVIAGTFAECDEGSLGLVPIANWYGLTILPKLSHDCIKSTLVNSPLLLVKYFSVDQ